MFKDDYQKAMSFPVNEGLLNQTALLMAERQKNPYQKKRNYTIPKAIAAAAAFCLLITEVIGFAGLSKSSVGGAPEAETGGAYSFAAGGVNEENDEAKDFALFGSPAPTDGGMGRAVNDSLVEGQWYDGLPVLPSQLSFSGSSSELLMAYTSEEAQSSNPPEVISAEFERLPVYQNFAVVGGEVSANENALTEKEMESYAKTVIKTLGLNESKASIQVEENEAEKSAVVQSYSIENVTILTSGEVTIYFGEDGLKSPKVTQKGATEKEQREKACAYFYKEYQHLFSIQDAAFSTNLSYTADGESYGRTIAYDTNGSLEEQLYSYSLDNVYLGVTKVAGTDAEYQLNELSFRVTRLTEPIGEYPVISEKEARAALLSGAYQTTVAAEAPITEDSIEAVELIYYNDQAQTYYIPCYRFLVKLASKDTFSMSEGLYAYGNFYVPAVQAEYLDNGQEQ